MKKFWSCIYSNKDPLNRLDEIMKLITAWRISRFTLSARAGLPYNSILHKVEILNGKIITSMFRRSSKRIVRWSEKLEQCNRKCSVVSMALVRQEQKGSTMSKKPCLNLCSRRWLKPTLSRVSKISPFVIYYFKCWRRARTYELKNGTFKRSNRWEISYMTIQLVPLRNTIGKEGITITLCSSIKRTNGWPKS